MSDWIEGIALRIEELIHATREQTDVLTALQKTLSASEAKHLIAIRAMERDLYTIAVAQTHMANATSEAWQDARLAVDHERRRPQ